MKRCGIEYVRGGPYCQVVMPSGTFRALTKELNHDNKSDEHYIKQHPPKTKHDVDTNLVEEIEAGLANVSLANATSRRESIAILKSRMKKKPFIIISYSHLEEKKKRRKVKIKRGKG